MSNLNPEIIPEEPDANRISHQQSSGNPTKKKSGFQITSVTDSGHGRPSSIVRDGEESADDLDESHASYSDVSYSRATDADHDQESTASEDTLNISVHESSSVALAESAVNHVGAIHHPHHVHHVHQPVDVSLAPKAKLQKDTTQEIKKIHQVPPLSIPKNTLNKQQSENLDSPQELPHDSVIPGETVREKKTEDPEARVDLPQNSGSNVKVTTPKSAPEENLLHSTTTVLSSNISSVVTTQPSISGMSTDPVEAILTERPLTAATASITSATTTTKPVSVSTATSGIKAPGTRVYKVVKREATQPTKRSRDRWNWYDFTDTQAPMTGIAQSVGETRIANDNSGSLHTFAYTNTLMSPNVVPYTLQQSDSASSLLKDHLFKAGLSNTSSAINWDTGGLKTDSSGQVMGLGATDVLKTAITNYATRTPGDASTGDPSAAARALKIDNKIEAAMDLVKKHLMSAVRDEVDELKEKIKDLTEETARLKTENKELRAALPADVLSQVQASLSPPKDSSAKENHQNGDKSSNLNLTSNDAATTPLSVEQASQKGINVTKAQDGTLPHLGSSRQADHKMKIASSNAPQNTPIPSQRQQDVQKTSVTKITSIVGTQPVVTAQVHMHPSQPQGHNPPQNADTQHIMHEQVTLDNSKVNTKPHDPNFDKKNPP